MLRTEELEDFRDQLQSLNTELTGTAELTHLGGELEATVSLRDGVGTLAGFVRARLEAELRFGEFRTDQTFVRASLEEFDELVREFPVCGNAHA